MGSADEDFAEFAAARYASLVRSARLLGFGPDEAQDLVQSTLLRCYRAWHRIERAHHPDAYVYRVLVNQGRRTFRRRWRGEVPTTSAQLTEAGDQDAGTGGDHDVSLTVRAALRTLSPGHRAVLVLRFDAGLSERDTAAALGIPLGTVKSRTSRALEELSRQPGLAGLTTAGSRENHAD